MSRSPQDDPSSGESQLSGGVDDLAILRVVPGLLLEVGRDGTCLRPLTDDAALPILPEAVIGRHVSELLTAASAEVARDRIAAVFETGEVQTFFVEADLPGGRRELKARAAVRPGTDRALVLLRDVTEQKVAEAALRESEERFLQLAENFRKAIYFVAPDLSQFFYVSAAYEDIWGETPDSLMNEPQRLLEAILPDDRGRVNRLLRRVGQGEKGLVAEYRISRPDGEVRHIRDCYSAVTDEAGEVYRVIGIAEDVTGLKAAEEKLRVQGLMFELATDAIMIHGFEGAITYWNRGAERLYGWLGEEAVGRPVDRLLETRHLIPLEEARAEFFREGTWEGEVYRKRRDGTEVAVATRWTLWRDAEGIPSAILEIANDVTERKRAETAMVAAKEEAERANLAKSEFLSRMSHELRTPLNAILGFGQVLEMEQLPADQRESVSHILRGGRHLLALINEVLDIARVEAGALALSLETVPLSEVVGEALMLMRPAAQQRDVTLPSGPGADCDRFIRADYQRLLQVLLNLFSNAIKYNRDGGRIEVDCEASTPERVRLVVTDTGIGIPPDQMDLLFQPFERLGAERTAVEGSGLGLAVSRALLHAMGGRIGVDSTVGEGSRFWIELPVATVGVSEETDPAAPVAAPETVKETASRTVLVIEDNLANLRLVERILSRRPGVRLISAMQGRLGVELASQHLPDVVLLDLHLPDLTGEQVFQRLREDPRTAGIPVVVLSADALPRRIRRLRDAGVRGYLTKPLDVGEFIRLLDDVLGAERPVK